MKGHHHQEEHHLSEHVDDFELEDISAHQKEVRRKLEQRLERRRLKQELEDYEGELDQEFDWDD